MVGGWRVGGVPEVRGHDRVFLLSLVCTAGDRHVRAGNQLCRGVVFSIPLMVGGWRVGGVPEVRGHDRVFLLPLVCTAGDRHVRAGNQLCRGVVFSIPLIRGHDRVFLLPPGGRVEGRGGGSQRSVDMIVSSSFLLSVLLVIVMCVQVISCAEV